MKNMLQGLDATVKLQALGESLLKNLLGKRLKKISKRIAYVDSHTRMQGPLARTQPTAYMCRWAVRKAPHNSTPP